MFECETRTGTPDIWREIKENPSEGNFLVYNVKFEDGSDSLLIIKDPLNKIIVVERVDELKLIERMFRQGVVWGLYAQDVNSYIEDQFSSKRLDESPPVKVVQFTVNDRIDFLGKSTQFIQDNERILRSNTPEDDSGNWFFTKLSQILRQRE